MKYLGIDIEDDDKFLFVILFRTIKEFGYYSYKLKNLGFHKSEMIEKCLNSRKIFCGEENENESFYYNVSIWPFDIGIKSNDLIRMVYICRVINSKELKNDMLKKDVIDWICSNAYICCEKESKYNGCVLSALRKIKKIKRPKKDSAFYKTITHEIDEYAKIKNINEDTFITS